MLKSHTTGPWSYKAVEGGVRIVDETDLTIAIIRRPLNDPFDTVKEDAQLIAASPELLFCMKNALRIIASEDGCDWDNPPSWFRSEYSYMYDAIEKAEGGFLGMCSNPDRAIAHAKLKAAAPELLSVLKDIYDHGYSFSDHDKALCAIQKATGAS